MKTVTDFVKIEVFYFLDKKVQYILLIVIVKFIFKRYLLFRHTKGSVRIGSLTLRYLKEAHI